MELEYGYIIVSAAITIVACILCIVSLHSYRIYRNAKLLFVLLVFVFFLTKGILLSLSLFYHQFTDISSSYYFLMTDLIILTLLYLAAFKR
ncbi:MAG: hypothetical protein V1726_07335 [Methanobacteriota archaeon]